MSDCRRFLNLTSISTLQEAIVLDTEWNDNKDCIWKFEPSEYL